MKKYLLINISIFLIVSFGIAQTVTDYDGNTYNTITIGTQVWMKENLKVTHYNNGDAIPNITDNTAWSGLTSGAYSSYNNDINYANVYGNLYNFYAVADNRKVCPVNWHVPASWEWNNLVTELGGSSAAGSKLKETGNTHWLTPNSDATNESGFSCLPGGLRMNTGAFAQVTKYAYLWTSSDQDTYNSLYRWLSYLDGNVNSNPGTKSYGQSVRCIRDFPSNVNELNNNYKINIYPNPVNDILNIDQLNNDFTSITIYNILGEIVLQNQTLNKSNVIDVKSLPSGVYMMRLSGDQGKKLQIRLLKK